ncbi:FkbM family methyltransferase [Apibacter raozihei]|uniref:FkbM family methyltransferase n=1 Tax=Apibacter raozihei TaxID=2500547 RepID=UPI000FE33721|nr:FkbM family methyltransferase [Apibacter raozihei]
MNLLRKKAIDLAYSYWPSLYKKRFFKKINQLNALNIKQRNVEFEFLILSRFLDKDSVFFDIGVNMGYYIYYAEQLVHPENIVGFEPHPELYKRIKHLFPKIHTSNIALSNTCEVLNFKVPIINSHETTGRGTLNTEYKEENETSSKIYEVQTETLDRFIKNHQIEKISFIKIDVEGAEIKVIEGAKETLRKFRPTLLIEVEERHHNQNIWNIIQPILELGYLSFYLDRETLELKEFTSSTPTYQNTSELHNKTTYINNFIFLSK